jgi:hypothetical protein
VETIEEAVKQRPRELSAGELMVSPAETVMVSPAETVMVGGHYLVHPDQLRGDLAGAELRAVWMSRGRPAEEIARNPAEGIVRTQRS